MSLFFAIGWIVVVKGETRFPKDRHLRYLYGTSETIDAEAVASED
jgi:hypothetical protein